MDEVSRLRAATIANVRALWAELAGIETFPERGAQLEGEGPIGRSQTGRCPAVSL